MKYSRAGKNKFLKLDNITVGYPNHILAKKVNLVLKEGDFFILSGPNGSGKSTLARLVLGVQKPLEGKIENFFSKKAYVPQKSEIDLSYPITFYEFIDCGLVNHFFSVPFTKNRLKAEKIRWVMEELEVWEKRHLNFSKASGGEIQRCFIARAMAMEPDFMLLDEPFSNLDKKGRQKLSQLLLELNQIKKITFFVIDHHQIFSQEKVKYYRLENGKLIHDRKPY